MTTLVTGAFGCIGAWVVRKLVAAYRERIMRNWKDYRKKVKARLGKT